MNAPTKGKLSWVLACGLIAPCVLAKPAILVDGMKDRAIYPPAAIALFETMWPEAPITKLPNAGHFCQEDAPEIIIPLIRQFVALTK